MYAQLFADYKSVSQAAMSVTFLAFGNLSTDLFAVSPEFGPVLVFFVILILSLILLNIFIAVTYPRTYVVVPTDFLNLSEMNFSSTELGRDVPCSSAEFTFMIFCCVQVISEVYNSVLGTAVELWNESLTERMTKSLEKTSSKLKLRRGNDTELREADVPWDVSSIEQNE